MEKYFQTYKKEYNADEFLIDRKFIEVSAMDILDKKRDDAIICKTWLF